MNVVPAGGDESSQIESEALKSLGCLASDAGVQRGFSAAGQCAAGEDAAKVGRLQPDIANLLLHVVSYPMA
jgi:hypothetical protein